MTTNSDLRIGVIGCGRLARLAHVPLLARTPGAKITALCDTDPASTQSCAVYAPAAQQFTESADLINSGLVDAVVIPLPSHLHVNSAVAAFSAGKHVYLEKPIASYLDEADEIILAWKASGKTGMIGQNYRYNPLIVKLKRQYESGRIAKLTNVRTRFAIPHLPPGNWRAARASGGGALLDLAVHHIDLIRFVTGMEITSVSAAIESRYSDDDIGRLDMELERGVTAHTEVIFGEEFEDRFEVTGERGTLWVERSQSFDVGFRSLSGQNAIVSKILAATPTPYKAAYFLAKRKSPLNEPSFALALAAFVRAATNGTPATPDLNDGLAALEVVDAAERSARERARMQPRSAAAQVSSANRY